MFSSATINYSLDKLDLFLKKLGHPQLALKNIIHIAGTNGKGSTLTFLSAALQEAGFRVGAFTSPHIKNYQERIALNGQPISKKEFDAFERNLKKIKGFVKLTEFERLTIISVLYFKAQKPDFIIYEVGLGGRLDATNIFEPILTIITKIGLDHQEFLGRTLTTIARDKAGIIKPHIPLVTIAQSPKVISVFKEICQEKKAPLKIVHKLAAIPPGYSLSGSFQQENLALAKAALAVLGAQKDSSMQHISAQVFERGLSKAFIWGRYLKLKKEHQIIIVDCAHNALGVRNLIKTLQKDYPHQKFSFLLGIKHDKNARQMLKSLEPLASRLYYCDWDPTFSYNFSQIRKLFKSPKLTEFRLKEPLPQDTHLVITGSIYFVSTLHSILANVTAGDIPLSLYKKRGRNKKVTNLIPNPQPLQHSSGEGPTTP
jgi:dihydrofolate synthase / folylpolyglutamate synthase